MPLFRAASITAAKRSMLSSMEQLMFFCENVSEAAPKTAISSTPAARAAWNPCMLGTSAE